MGTKLPPPEKIYEAWSAIASDRIELLSPADAESGEALATSSTGLKQYKLRWQGNIYESTDSATWWQGYPGYPIIALLMLRSILPYDGKIASVFANIDWNAVNRKARGNYAQAVAEVFSELNLKGEKAEKIREFAAQTQNDLANLDIIARRYRAKKSND